MDQSDTLLEQVRAAAQSGSPLVIVAGNSKPRPGRETPGQRLDLSGHQGVVDYQPGELVITVRAGTTIEELEKTLAEQRQYLAFEPPQFGTKSTIGGTVACGLSGPRRPYAGAIRDFVLGVKMINGRGEALRFGGQVIKNVAGYDLSRLMVGAYGTLGCLLELSIKTLPRPPVEKTLRLEKSLSEFLSFSAVLGRKPFPVSAVCLYRDRMYIRLSGAERALVPATAFIGGEEETDSQSFWAGIRDRSHPFFATDKPLWRIVLPPGHPRLNLAGDCLVDWGGGQRWLLTHADPRTVHRAASEARGHATWISGAPRDAEVFQALPPALMALHCRIKHAMDPSRIFNRGRMYAEL